MRTARSARATARPDATAAVACDAAPNAPGGAGLEEWLAGSSLAMRRLRSRVAALAPLWTPVLVTGPPGSGRDAVADAIHTLGATARGEIVRIDARSFSEGCPLPQHGAVYLDAVEGLDAAGQRLWARQLGHGTAPPPLQPVRLLASSADPPLLLDPTWKFDPQLRRALLRFRLRIPALTERREDLAPIAEAVLRRISPSVGRNGIRLSCEALAFLAAQRWPGNVRQLEELLTRAVAFSTGRELDLGLVQDVFAELEESLEQMRQQRRAAERVRLLRALRATGGNVTRTAERLGRSRSAVYRLIEKHGIALSRAR